MFTKQTAEKGIHLLRLLADPDMTSFLRIEETSITCENAVQFIPLVQALLDNNLQMWENGNWLNVQACLFDRDIACYRVRPTVVKRWIAINSFSANPVGSRFYLTKEEAKRAYDRVANTYFKEIEIAL